MVALSIKLPKELAEASKEAARRLGLTRSQLIRQALVHELERVEAERERGAMAESFRAMGRDSRYLKEAERLDDAFGEPLREERDEWWRG